MHVKTTYSTYYPPFIYVKKRNKHTKTFLNTYKLIKNNIMFIPQITFHRITPKLEKAIKIHHLNPKLHTF